MPDVGELVSVAIVPLSVTDVLLSWETVLLSTVSVFVDVSVVGGSHVFNYSSGIVTLN